MLSSGGGGGGGDVGGLGLVPLDIIWQPDAASMLQTSSTKLPLLRSSGLEKEVLLATRCGGIGGGPVLGVGVGVGERGVMDLGGNGGAGGGL